MYINKNKIKRLVATGLVLVNTLAFGSSKAQSYTASEDKDLYDVCIEIYGEDNIDNNIVALMKLNNLKTSRIKNGTTIELFNDSNVVKEIVSDSDFYGYKENNSYKVDITDGNVLGIYLPRINGEMGYVNVIGSFNTNIDFNDMIMNINDIDLDKINGIYMEYKPGSVLVKADGVEFNLNLFCDKEGIIDRINEINNEDSLVNKTGIELVYDNDKIVGFYAMKTNGEMGYVNVLGTFNNNIDFNSMIFSFDKIDLTKLNGYAITYNLNSVSIKINDEDVMLNLYCDKTGVIEVNNINYNIENNVVVNETNIVKETNIINETTIINETNITNINVDNNVNEIKEEKEINYNNYDYNYSGDIKYVFDVNTDKIYIK